MILISFFLLLTQSKLERGDDPYQILGIPRSALKSEIKSAYKKLTMQLHPDINKEEGAEKKWMCVNEAYEVLNDPDRKARFDRFGSFDVFDAAPENDSPTTFFSETSIDISQYGFKNVTEDNFENFTKNIGDYIILVYRSVMSHESAAYLYHFAKFKTSYDRLIHCAILDTFTHAEFARKLGAKRNPSFIFIKKTRNTTEYSYLESQIRQESDLIEFWRKQYPARIEKLYNVNDLKKFLAKDEFTPHVVQHVRRNAPSIVFQRMAHIIGGSMRYAVFLNDSFAASRYFNITLYPEILVYRNKNLKPIHISSMKKAPMDMVNYLLPVLYPIDGYTINRFCQEMCHVRCGFPSTFEAQKLIDTNMSLGYVEVDSPFAKVAEMKEGDWIAFIPQYASYIKLNPRLDDKSTLRYFHEDYEKHKLTVRQFPEGFDITLTWEALGREFSRFMAFFSESIEPAKVYIWLAILMFVLNFILGRLRRQKAKKD